MKIKALKISNVLSFPYSENIDGAQNILFDKDLSILIGQNGAGKSTVLEVINFVFRRVLFIPYNRNLDLYSQRSSIDVGQKRNILAKIDNVQYYRGFRLDKNYDFLEKPQTLRIEIELDSIDKSNIDHLKTNRSNLSPMLDIYSAEGMFSEGQIQDSYIIDINLDSANQTYSVSTTQDMGYTYLSAYNLYKELIELYNEENPDNAVSNLAESFSLIGGYRNYNSYLTAVSIGGGATAPKQIRDIRISESSKSMNTAENTEPSIFSLVRLRMADFCAESILTKMDKSESEKAANELTFIKRINEKLSIINLRVEIKLVNHASWEFTFHFIDTRRNQPLLDINSLSAGQKAITHLVFEAYGRGELSGGLVIIDEPEIHLHYQFQNEYLRVLEKLNKEQGCQYILVTHSESLINSQTIKNVIRLSLDKQNHTMIHQPTISSNQKWLVKMLDNMRSTHAFFGSKVLLVEGETDRYFFRASIEEIESRTKLGLVQDIAVINIDGKDSSKEWRILFESFGLEVHYVADLDYAFKLYSEQALKLNTQVKINNFLSSHPDLDTKIEAEYLNKVYILKKGALEDYLAIPKGLSHVITFCEDQIGTFIVGTDEKNVEISDILQRVTGK